MKTSTTSVDVRKPRTPVAYLGLTLRGFLMGVADLVPGVSGGTIALLTGIYEELIFSIRNVARPPFWRALATLRLGAAIEAINLRFLLAVGTGIILAVFIFSRILEPLLAHYPELLWSFFFGLVLASAAIVQKRVRRWPPAILFSVLAGAVVSYTLVGLVPTVTPETRWFLFFAGAVTICAMILPGISGAFILVFLGKYQYMVAAVNQRDFMSIAVFLAGAAVGIVTFAQLLGWLFRRFHDTTLAFLVGVMLGSLRKIWPWKSQTVTVDELGVTIPALESNTLPPLFIGASFNLQILLAILLACLGVLAVLGLEQLARREKELVAESSS